MKKILTLALIFTFLWVSACKKAENKEENPATKAPEKTVARHTPKKNKKAPEVSPLEIYYEKDLVTSIPPDQYSTLTTSRIKVGKSEVAAILLRDLLAKYKVKGKNVILVGPTLSVPLTWEQANLDGVYITVNPKQVVQIHSTSDKLVDIKFPKKITRITVSATSEAATSSRQARRAARK